MIEAEIVHTANREFPWTIWRLRVPGGWIYHIAGTCPVFVPEETIVQNADEAPTFNFTPLNNK